MGFLPCKAEQPLQCVRSTKRLKYTRNPFKKNQQIKDLKLFRSGQRKTFYRQRIPESNSVKKESVDIDILIWMVTEKSWDGISRDGGRKILQSIMVTSRLWRFSKWNKLRQFRRTSNRMSLKKI